MPSKVLSVLVNMCLALLRVGCFHDSTRYLQSFSLGPCSKAEQVASYRLFTIYISTRGTEIGKGGPVLSAKIGPVGPILVADRFFRYSSALCGSEWCY